MASPPARKKTKAPEAAIECTTCLIHQKASESKRDPKMKRQLYPVLLFLFLVSPFVCWGNNSGFSFWDSFSKYAPIAFGAAAVTGIAMFLIERSKKPKNKEWKRQPKAYSALFARQILLSWLGKGFSLLRFCLPISSSCPLAYTPTKDSLVFFLEYCILMRVSPV